MVFTVVSSNRQSAMLEGIDCELFIEVLPQSHDPVDQGISRWACHISTGSKLVDSTCHPFILLLGYIFFEWLNNFNFFNSFIIVEITGLRRLENGLVVPGKFTAFTKSAAIGQKLKEQLTHVKELCKHMEIEITGSGLRERNNSPVLMLL